MILASARYLLLMAFSYLDGKDPESVKEERDAELFDKSDSHTV